MSLLEENILLGKDLGLNFITVDEEKRYFEIADAFY